MKTKIFEAACVGGVVTVSGLPVDATVLSEGVAPSTGIVIIEGDKLFYVAAIAGDIGSVIDLVADAITEIISALTVLNGVTVPPSAATANIAQVLAKNVLLQAKKELLK